MTVLYSVSKNCLRSFFWAFYSHEVALHTPSIQGAIIAANHASFFDPPLIAASWPEPIHFLARKTLFDVPILRPLIQRLNAHPLSTKGQMGALKQMTELLQEKKTILIFPEGTRSTDGSIAPFKSGVGLLAKRANAPIIPAYIHGSFQIWPRSKGWPHLFGYHSMCLFGAPIWPEEEVEKEALTQRVEDAVRLLQNKVSL